MTALGFLHQTARGQIWAGFDVESSMHPCPENFRFWSAQPPGLTSNFVGEQFRRTPSHPGPRPRTQLRGVPWSRRSDAPCAVHNFSRFGHPSHDLADQFSFDAWRMVDGVRDLSAMTKQDPQTTPKQLSAFHFRAFARVWSVWSVWHFGVGSGM